MEDLLTELRIACESIDHLGAAHRRQWAQVQEQQSRMWDRVEELGDGLVALSNRLEALTRGLTVSPAEAAEAMMDTQRRVRDADV